MAIRADQVAHGELAPVNPGWSFLLFLPLALHLRHLLHWSRGLRQAWSRIDPAEGAPSLDLTVVLPVRNEAETLPRLLADLAGQSLWPSEVIVIDDASEDGTREAVESAGPCPFPLRIRPNPGTGKKAGLSAGIRESHTEWVVGLDADVRLGPTALAAMVEGLAGRHSEWDMALLPLRIARRAEGPPEDMLTGLQALDFAAMQGWAVAAVLRGRPAMASGGGWMWRRDAFPHDQLKPELPSGDDVFSLAALIERGDGHRVGWIGDRRAMVSAGPMDTLGTLLDQRIRWGAKSTRYPKALSEARRVAWTVTTVHAAGLVLLVLDPLLGAAFWGTKSAADMAYTAQVGAMYTLLPKRRPHTLWSLFLLAISHPIFIATTLLLMPFRTGRWKGRPAT
jgi:biofilm PGA synthesis N-glycosyltransferase PgaC